MFFNQVSHLPLSFQLKNYRQCCHILCKLCYSKSGLTLFLIWSIRTYINTNPKLGDAEKPTGKRHILRYRSTTLELSSVTAMTVDRVTNSLQPTSLIVCICTICLLFIGMTIWCNLAWNLFGESVPRRSKRWTN